MKLKNENEEAVINYMGEQLAKAKDIIEKLLENDTQFLEPAFL